MKPSPRWPVEAYRRAHAAYPAAVAARSLYGVAFFGHGRPLGVAHRETCESVWRGLVRRALREYCEGARS